MNALSDHRYDWHSQPWYRMYLVQGYGERKPHRVILQDTKTDKLFIKGYTQRKINIDIDRTFEIDAVDGGVDPSERTVIVCSWIDRKAILAEIELLYSQKYDCYVEARRLLATD